MLYQHKHCSRDCGVGTSDIDFSLELEWWRSGNNSVRLESALLEAGFEIIVRFGPHLQVGFEETWKKDGVRVSTVDSYEVILNVLPFHSTVSNFRKTNILVMFHFNFFSV